ncbi:MAG: hybrid sensor histidine kinase/response regulator [Anaerolineae bacterium]|nr:hybrid sensor histidine kinase/response regulator [Anaerolineae bacterium]
MSGDILVVTQSTSSALGPLQTALIDEGYTVRFATDADTALQQARQRPPVAVVVDVTIRAPDDVALCRWLRTDPSTIAVKLLVTANTPAQRLAALEAGADELLTAPLDWVELRTRLRTLRAGQSRLPSLEDFLSFTPDLMLGANPVDILGMADLLSHDLKSPVSIIVSSLELLREYAEDRQSGDDNPQVAREVRLAQNALLACRRLIFLISDMVDLAKMEADAFPLDIVPFNLLSVAREVLAENASAIAHKGIMLRLNAPDDLPPALGDRTLTKRICTALIDNMIKFTKPDDQTLFQLAADDSYLVARFIDHGRPVMPAHREAIFERAVQWEARQEGQRSSVAMGLPFARTAARRMNGDLTAASNSAEGTTAFTLRLPRALV